MMSQPIVAPLGFNMLPSLHLIGAAHNSVAKAAPIKDGEWKQ